MKELIKKVLILIRKKKHSWPKNWTFSWKLSFASAYQIKYFSVPNIREFAKNFRNCESVLLKVLL